MDLSPHHETMVTETVDSLRLALDDEKKQSFALYSRLEVKQKQITKIQHTSRKRMLAMRSKDSRIKELKQEVQHLRSNMASALHRIATLEKELSDLPALQKKINRIGIAASRT